MAEPLLLLGSLAKEPCPRLKPDLQQAQEHLEMNMIGVPINFRQLCSIVLFGLSEKFI